MSDESSIPTISNFESSLICAGIEKTEVFATSVRVSCQAPDAHRKDDCRHGPPNNLIRILGLLRTIFVATITRAFAGTTSVLLMLGSHARKMFYPHVPMLSVLIPFGSCIYNMQTILRSAIMHYKLVIPEFSGLLDDPVRMGALYKAVDEAFSSTAVVSNHPSVNWYFPSQVRDMVWLLSQIFVTTVDDQYLEEYCFNTLSGENQALLQASKEKATDLGAAGGIAQVKSYMDKHGVDDFAEAKAKMLSELGAAGFTAQVKSYMDKHGLDDFAEGKAKMLSELGVAGFTAQVKSYMDKHGLDDFAEAKAKMLSELGVAKFIATVESYMDKHGVDDFVEAKSRMLSERGTAGFTAGVESYMDKHGLDDFAEAKSRMQSERGKKRGERQLAPIMSRIDCFVDEYALTHNIPDNDIAKAEMVRAWGTQPDGIDKVPPDLGGRVPWTVIDPHGEVSQYH